MKKFLTIMLALIMVLSVATGMAVAETEREQITITMFSMPANTSGTLENTWWTNYLKEQLGITIELLPSGDNDDTKMQSLLAADALPDIVVFEGTTYLKNAIDAGMLVCLDDYADSMPNAQKYVKESMQYYADNVSGDGKCYCISNNIGARLDTDRLNYTVSLRYDLYQQVGSPEIKTTWDYLDVLKQMQDLYPENEEGQKVYAICAFSDWDGYAVSPAMYYSMLDGVDTGEKNINNMPFTQVDFKTGEVSTTLSPDSKYVEALKWYYTANQMGILDPDSMTNTYSTYKEKVAAGRTLFAWWLWSVGGYNTPEHVNADEPTGFSIVLPTESTITLQGDDPIGSGWCWAISNKSEHIDRCIEYLDFMCDPDNIFVLANGRQGECWDINEDGQPYLTEKGIKLRSGEIEETDEGGTIGAGLGTINSYPIMNGTVSEKYGATINCGGWATYTQEVSKLEQTRIDATGYTNAIDQKIENGSYVNIPLACSLTAPLTDDMQILASQIGDVVRTQSWLAIYAESDEEFDAIINEMCETAEGLGLSELMEYNKTVWENALELAAKYE